MLRRGSVIGLAALGLGVLLEAGQAAPVGTGFSFQGQLKDGGIPAGGDFDMRFSLFAQEVGGAAAAGPLVFDGASGNAAAVSVANGLFRVELDFGAAFDGTALWLEIEVRNHGDGDYTPLIPRQALTATPMALYALNGPGGDGSWIDQGADLSNANAGNVGIGTDAPTSKLHVNGDIRSDGMFGHVSHNPNNASAFAALSWINDVARIRVGGDGPGATGGLDIQKTGDRSLMRIYDSGDIWCRGGIDVTGDVLTRTGSLRSASPSAESEVFLGWGADGDGAEMARIRIGGDGVGAHNGLDFQRVGNVSLMRLLNNGNLGLGTTTPTRTLSVEGDGYVASNFGVGTSSPAVRLQVTGGSDVSLGSGGFAALGPVTGQNLGMDNNEIMARNNGSPATLFINQDGGSVVIGGGASSPRLGVGTSLPTERIDLGGGNIKMGYELAYDLSGSVSLAFARCTGGRVVIGGGCDCGDNEIERSVPFEDSISHGWSCRCGGSVASATAICANMR